MAADPHDGADLRRYWTKDPRGLSKWATSAHPWTTLVALLSRFVSDPEGLASSYFHDVFGYWPGERAGSNPIGRG